MRNFRLWTIVASTALVVALSGMSSNGWAKSKKEPAKPASAEKPPVDAAAPPSAEADPAVDGVPDEDPYAEVKHEKGPKTLSLGDGLEVNIPAGFIFLDPSVLTPSFIKEGADVTGYKGSMLSLADDSWRIDVQYYDKGYVSDKDAADLHAKELFDSYVQGTNAMNATRRQNGITELFIDSWQTEPRYDASKHHLVWGLNAHSTNGKVVNLVTNLLGRRGLVEIMLIAEAEKVDAQQVLAQPAMDGVRFTAGSTYEDFDASTDKSSGLGLRALVLGGVGVAVAKKTGLLLVILLAMKKGAFVILAPIALLFKKIFGGKSNDSNNV